MTWKHSPTRMKLFSDIIWGWKAVHLNRYGTQWTGPMWKMRIELPAWRGFGKAYEEVAGLVWQFDFQLFTGCMSPRSKFSQVNINVIGVLMSLNPRFSTTWYKSHPDHANSRMLSSSTNSLSYLTVSFVNEEERYAQRKCRSLKVAPPLSLSV